MRTTRARTLAGSTAALCAAAADDRQLPTQASSRTI